MPDYEDPADEDNDDTDGEMPDNVYEVTVNVRDSKVNTTTNNGNADTAVDASIAVIVTVTDVNERPTITTTTSTISKPEGTATTEVLATYEASDPESDSLTWSLSGNDSGDFSITNGQLKFTAAPDYEDPADSGADNSYSVTVNVRDSKVNTRGMTNGDADTAVDDSIAVTITVTNVNESPTITTMAATHTAPSVAENTQASTVIATYGATDPDMQAGNTLMWSLEGNDAGDFTINPSSGALTFNASPDFETPMGSGTPADNTYELTVKVTDNGIPTNRTATLNATLSVIVTVTNVNEAPTITTGPTSTSIFENSTTVATFTATDPDANTTLSWDVGSPPTTAGDSLSVLPACSRSRSPPTSRCRTRLALPTTNTSVTVIGHRQRHPHQPWSHAERHPAPSPSPSRTRMRTAASPSRYGGTASSLQEIWS